MLAWRATVRRLRIALKQPRRAFALLVGRCSCDPHDDGPPARFVVIAFDTEEKAKVWRDSPAIKEVNAVRLRTTKSRSFIVDGLAN
jgi:uncharacterized protein (DUF1330 family)